MSFVVTGASGHLGGLVVDGLLKAGEPVAAVVRDKDKAARLAERGVEVRVADYDEPEALREAFRAGDRVLFVSGSEPGRREPQHRNVVEAARDAGVALLAYTSVLGGPEADFVLAADHKATEQAILDAGVPYTFLRNGFYHEVYTETIPQALERGAVTASAGDGRIATASRADYAAAAVAVLTGEGHEGRAYELCGDTAWSFAEFAAELSKQSGRAVEYRPLTTEEHRGLLLGAGLPEPVADLVADIDRAIERGLLTRTSDDLRHLIGRPPTPLAEAITSALKH
ncbi:SDR family oxidoreductase [Nonomuraea sp. C10]|uniref:SDR family oxidoreductase n=1 Tax=Nonomuraea sp. C10 TaxID=2600577 RepID=UPI0011CDC65F|nr:SDR family oxidoreductase [Nonomuraea sp. C10]TXK34497.1 SDR family oxidoreductase [Nonomuraea sp. C10]